MTGPHRSLTLRLTLGLGAIALAVFSAAALLLHEALARDLADADLQALHRKTQVVQHFIAESMKAAGAVTLQAYLSDLRIGHSDLRVWVHAADGQSIFGSESAEAEGPVDKFGLRRIRLPGALTMDALDTTLTDATAWPGGTVRVALDTGPRERLLEKHGNTLFGVSLLATLLTVGLSAVASRRNLRPVQQLSDQARRITPDALGVRLTDPRGDIELAGLVGAFNAVLDRLESAYRQMEAFSANVAHELRTPLATLINGTQVIVSGQRSAAELKDVLLSHLEDLEQLSALVNDMLFLARADQGGRAQGLEDVDLGFEIDKTLHFCSVLLDEAGVAAQRSGAARGTCNPPLIRRALVNLLSNAIRHTCGGQAITVSVEEFEDGVKLGVHNPGPPIPEPVRHHMFDRFYKADGALPRGGDSHGLGLTIVKAIARMHGGEVFVERHGDGNRVGLTLPRRATAAPISG